MAATAVPIDVELAGSPAPPVLLRLRSDEQLVALFRAGNEEAFSVIHDRFQVRLLSYVRRMLPPGPRANAEDVLQDVFLRAYSALRADERPIALKAWLYRVAHNRCIDELRRPGPQPTEIVEQEGDPRLDPALAAERRERLRRLVVDLGRLPEQQRSALLMRELEGFSYKELGEALDVSQPAVKSLLVRARMGLAEAAQARETDCEDIREDLAAARDRRVRSSARARRHLRDCDECRGFDRALRSTSRDLAALLPGPGLLAMIAGLFGLGGGASAGGGAAAGGGIAGIAGGGAAAATATKVAVAVCCVAATAGGAASVEHTLRHQTPVPRSAPAAPTAQPASPATGTDLQMGAVEPETGAPAAAPDAAAPTPAADAEPLPPDAPQAAAPASDEVTPAADEAGPPDDPATPTTGSTGTPASTTPASSVSGPATTTAAPPAPASATEPAAPTAATAAVTSP